MPSCLRFVEAHYGRIGLCPVFLVTAKTSVGRVLPVPVLIPRWGLPDGWLSLNLLILEGLGMLVSLLTGWPVGFWCRVGAAVTHPRHLRFLESETSIIPYDPEFETYD